MQINDNYKKAAGWIIRLLILCACVWVISESVVDRWSFDFSFTGLQIGLILLVVALMPFNWGLEVWRWKYSLDTINKTTWHEAGRQVFSGLALNWVLPFTSGDLIARLTPNVDRKKVALLVVYNRALMLGLTLLFGVYGIYRFSQTLLSSYQLSLIIGLLLAFITIVIIGIRLKKVGPDSWNWLLPVAVISLVRYLIFTIQFVVLLYSFNQDITIGLLIAGVGWIFFFRSVIPSLFGNLGVREVGALVFFEAYVTDPSLVLVPSLLIWLINTVTPSILGLYFVLNYKT